MSSVFDRVEGVLLEDAFFYFSLRPNVLKF